MALNSAQLIGTGQLDGLRNRIINGRMRIDQRNIGTALTINTANAVSSFPVDRFRFGSGGGSWGTGVLSAQQRNGVLTANPNYEAGASPGAQVTNGSLKLTVTTADSSLASTDGYTLSHLLELGSIADFAFGSANAQTVTLSFWVKSSITGTYCASLYSAGSGRSYVATYTIAAANTWEYKAITIPGDTSGTWFQTDPALNVRWDLGSGTGNNAASANTWSAGDFTRVSSAVNWISTLNATFYITGVQLEKGSVATELEFQSFGQDLALCQRYYQKSYDQAIAPAANDSTGCREALGNGLGLYSASVTFPVVMRSAPTITLYGPTGAASTLSVGSTVGQSGFFVTQSGGTTNSSNRFHYVASSELS